MATLTLDFPDVASRNLGGGMFIAGGDLTVDTGLYATGGIIPDIPLALLDTRANREPDFVMFFDDDGFQWFYDYGTGAIKIFVITASGDPAGQVNLALAEHENGVAVAGYTMGFIAFWFPEWDVSTGPI